MQARREAAPVKIGARQVRRARAIVQWYLATHFGTAADPGTLSALCDERTMGTFAPRLDAVLEGESGALFRLLVATTMFQRRQDQQIMRILRGIASGDAREMTNAETLLRLADESPCPAARSNAQLLGTCDLGKDARGQGTCGVNPSVACHLKRHTVLLKRYGHFGKVPMSAALMLRDAGWTDLNELRRDIYAREDDPLARAVALEGALSASWRISEKIASMFLSAVTNAELNGGRAPWSDGVDSSYFVVVDSNVDLFLSSMGYSGMSTYRARRTFVQALAKRIDLSEMRAGLSPYNPRIVQQALYLFMSVANRRALPADCSRSGPSACRACDGALRSQCSMRSDVSRRRTSRAGLHQQAAE